METKIYLLIHSRSNKVHIQTPGTSTSQGPLCGTDSYMLHNKMIFSPTWSPSKHPDWCTKCIAKMAIRLTKRNGAGTLRPVMDYVLNASVKKKVKKEKVIDSVRTELTFDDEEMVIKVLAGESTGARGNFAVKAGMEFTLGWDKLNEIRDLTEKTEEVKLTIFKARKPNEV